MTAASKFTLVVFPDEVAAYQGFHELQQLHREGSVTVYGAAVVERDPDGTLSVRKRSESVPLGFALGALLGGLQTEFGPVRREPAPGKFAVVAEISDAWVTLLDDRMEALGGRIVCDWWRDIVQDVDAKVWRDIVQYVDANRTNVRDKDLGARRPRRCRTASRRG